MGQKIELTVRKDAINIEPLNWRSIRSLNKVLKAVTEELPEYKEKILSAFSSNANVSGGDFMTPTKENSEPKEEENLSTSIEIIFAAPAILDVCFNPLSKFFNDATTLTLEEIEDLELGDIKKIVETMLEENAKIFPQINRYLKNARSRQEQAAV